MLSGAGAALSGLAVHRLMLEVSADNLANLSTTGFQPSRVASGDLGASSGSGLSVGRGAQALAVQRYTTYGPLVPTGQDLDAAIMGAGFFPVEQNGQVLYTRAGSFRPDAQGYLVDGGGRRLTPAFQVPTDTASLTLDSQGHLRATDAHGQVVAETDLSLAVFSNPAGLSRLGGTLYQPTADSGAARLVAPGEGGAGLLAPGYLEGSAVDPVREIVSLYLARHGFSANLKVIKTTDEMTGALLDLKA